VQIDIRQQRRDAAALHGTYLTNHPFAIFQHARVEPFLDQPDHAPIRYPMLEKCHQPFMTQCVEGNSHTLPITRIFLPASPSLDHIMPLKVSLLLLMGEFNGKVEHTYS